MVRMGACRVPDRGSIPRRGVLFANLRTPTYLLHVYIPFSNIKPSIKATLPPSVII